MMQILLRLRKLFYIISLLKKVNEDYNDKINHEQQDNNLQIKISGLKYDHQE
jgi:hypothetical protein